MLFWDKNVKIYYFEMKMLKYIWNKKYDMMFVGFGELV